MTSARAPAGRSAIALARKSPCDPKTLTRAAQDFAEREPRFALEAGLTALYWLSLGHRYEITSIDVWGAYRRTLVVAEALGSLIPADDHDMASALTRAIVK